MRGEVPVTTVLDHLQNISRDLDKAIDELKTLELAAENAEAAYRVAKAKAFLSAEGTERAREHQAVLATQTELIKRGEAAALARVQVQKIKSLHARIDVGRTVASAEKTLAGVVT
jgi:hypothetical protein